DVRFDQRRRHQAPGEVDDLGRGRALGHGDDLAVIDAEIGEPVLAGHAGAAEDQIDHLAIMARPASPRPGGSGNALRVKQRRRGAPRGIGVPARVHDRFPRSPYPRRNILPLRGAAAWYLAWFTGGQDNALIFGAAVTWPWRPPTGRARPR